jgi:hypothetical protein
VAFRYSDLLVDVWASNGGCPSPSQPQCPSPSKPQCPNPSMQTGRQVTAPWGGLALLRDQLRHSVNDVRTLS